MSELLSLVRLALYGLAIFWSFFTFILAAAFVGRTNSDYNFYFSSAAELIVAGLLALATLPVLLFMSRSKSASVINRLYVELAVLAVLWLLFLGGAAALSNTLFCYGSSLCSLAKAVQAFAWLAWITLTPLLALCIFVGISGHSSTQGGVWSQPFSAEHTAFGRSTAAGGTPMQTKAGAAPASTSAPVAAAAPPAATETV